MKTDSADYKDGKQNYEGYLQFTGKDQRLFSFTPLEMLKLLYTFYDLSSATFIKNKPQVTTSLTG